MREVQTGGVVPGKAWTGSRMIDVRVPAPEDILLSEIATGLSREPRYGGAATAIVWSVAQHSLLCDDFAQADGITSPEVRRTILLHDAPEYMLRDLISPVKRLCPDYQQLEKSWWMAMAARFDLPFSPGGVVKDYDLLAAASEKATLIAPEAGEWPGLPAPRSIPAHLLAMTGAQAKGEFERRVRACTPPHLC